MKSSRIFPRLVCLMGAGVVLLAMVGGTFSPRAVAQAASQTRKFDPHSALTIRPLWHYARKISSAGAIPPCLVSTVPPRCYSPRQMRTAYTIQPLLNAGITGGGQTVVLIDFATSTTLTSDV